MNTSGSSALLSSLSLICLCPVCRVSPANEGRDGGGGRVYLLTGHLRPGEQRLGQLLHQTGALRSRGRGKSRTKSGTGHTSGKPHPRVRNVEGQTRITLRPTPRAFSAQELVMKRRRGRFHASENPGRNIPPDSLLTL